MTRLVLACCGASWFVLGQASAQDAPLGAPKKPAAEAAPVPKAPPPSASLPAALDAPPPAPAAHAPAADAPAADVPAPPVEVPAPPPAPPAEAANPPVPYYPQPAPAAAPPAYGAYDTAYAANAPRVRTRGPGPGSREHEGLFLRLTLGFGAGGARYRENIDGDREQTVVTRGVSTQLEVSLGGHLGGNFCLHGTLLAGSVDNADKTVSGTQDARDEISTSFVLLGPGGTYYFMPVNVYVSGVVGLGGLTEERDDESSIDSGEQGAGVGTMLMLGKEWWVGPRGEWGLGAALRGVYLAAPVRIAGVESRMRGAHTAIAFSATFN